MVLPEIIMFANPQVGHAYRQEFYADEAEDLAEIARIDDSTIVPFGFFGGLLVIREWNPHEPDVLEERYYAKGLGVIFEKKIEGGSETIELISAETGG